MTIGSRISYLSINPCDYIYIYVCVCVCVCWLNNKALQLDNEKFCRYGNTKPNLLDSGVDIEIEFTF